LHFRSLRKKWATSAICCSETGNSLPPVTQRCRVHVLMAAGHSAGPCVETSSGVNWLWAELRVFKLQPTHEWASPRIPPLCLSTMSRRMLESICSTYVATPTCTIRSMSTLLHFSQRKKLSQRQDIQQCLVANLHAWHFDKARVLWKVLGKGRICAWVAINVLHCAQLGRTGGVTDCASSSGVRAYSLLQKSSSISNFL
jgi:hypothetical protein